MTTKRKLGIVALLVGIALVVALPGVGADDPARDDPAGTEPDQESAMSPAPAKKPGTTQTRRARTRPVQTRPAQTRASAPATQTAPASTQEAPLVFTDEDLEKYRDGSPRPATRPARPEPAPPDPLKKFRERDEAARWRQERIAQYEKRILDLEARLKFLEQKRRAVQNPYLPRPTEGEEDPSEKGLSGPELLAKIDREVEGTTEQLETTRKDLAAFLEANPE